MGVDFLSVYPGTPSNTANCSRFNSLSRSIFIYRLRPHCAPAICRSRAAAGITAELPSGKAPTTCVLRRICFMNENTNGLLRQFFPKGTDFNKISEEEIDKAAALLDNRPRKCLNYRTPHEVLWSG